MWLVEHRKSTARNGWMTILRVVITCTALAVFQNMFFPFLWREDPLFVTFFYAVMIFAGIIALVYSYCNIAADGEFCCRLSAEQLECHCPVKDCGETFVVRLDDITDLEIDYAGDGPYSWYIYDRAGRRLKLTQNYGNPTSRIIAKIRELRPDLP